MDWRATEESRIRTELGQSLSTVGQMISPPALPPAQPPVAFPLLPDNELKVI